MPPLRGHWPRPLALRVPVLSPLPSPEQVAAFAEVYNVSTQQRFRTRTVRPNSTNQQSLSPTTCARVCRSPTPVVRVCRRQVSGHAHFLEFAETLSLRVDSPFDTLLLTVHHHLDHVPTKVT